VIEEIDRDGRGCRAYAAAIRRDVCFLLECEAIVMLDDWPQSQGARFELNVATMVGIPMFEMHHIKHDLHGTAGFFRSKITLPDTPTTEDLVHPYVD
jgi:hypothetical protein